MLKLSDFKQLSSNSNLPSFINLLKSKWDEVHSDPNIFLYKINDLSERIVDGKYKLTLNMDRGTNRRAPDDIISIQQPFQDGKFNFTKVSSKEILFTIDYQGNEHIVLINVSPINHYHTLLCPSVNKKLPQVVTEDSLELAVQIMFLADRELKIVFNSLCGFASVNHLHYHLMLDKQPYPVELVKWKQINGPLHCLADYPIPAFCFEVQKDTIQTNVSDIYRLIQYLLDNNIAHNILISSRRDNVAVFVYPRKSTVGIKSFGVFNVAALELSGWIPVYSTEAFHNVDSEYLENELRKSTLENIDELYKNVKMLY